MAKSAATRRAEREADGNADALLDQILGAEPEDDDFTDTPAEKTRSKREERDDEGVLVDKEEKPESKEPLADDGEPPAEGDEEAGDDDSGDDDLQGSERESASPADDDEDDDDKAEDEVSVKKREEGLIRDLQKLRRENQELVARLNPPAAPAPGQTTQVPKQGPPSTHIPIQVSPDGEQVYFDLADPRVQEYVRQQAQAANQPSEMQLRQQALDRVDQEYAASEPGNDYVVSRAKLADDMLSEHIRGMMLQGHRFDTITDAIGALRMRGVDQQVAQHFPELANIFDEFVEGMASGNPVWRRSLYSRIKPPRATAYGGGGALPQTTPKLGNAPTSMARKGGTRSESTTSDEREFSGLEAEFKHDFMIMPEEKWNRLQSLGKKLGKTGYE